MLVNGFYQKNLKGIRSIKEITNFIKSDMTQSFVKRCTSCLYMYVFNRIRLSSMVIFNCNFIRDIIEFIDLIKRTDRTNEGTLSILDMIIMFVEIIFIYRLLTSEVRKAVNAF